MWFLSWISAKCAGSRPNNDERLGYIWWLIPTELTDVEDDNHLQQPNASGSNNGDESNPVAKDFYPDTVATVTDSGAFDSQSRCPQISQNGAEFYEVLRPEYPDSTPGSIEGEQAIGWSPNTPLTTISEVEEDVALDLTLYDEFINMVRNNNGHNSVEVPACSPSNKISTVWGKIGVE